MAALANVAAGRYLRTAALKQPTGKAVYEYSIRITANLPDPPGCLKALGQREDFVPVVPQKEVIFMRSIATSTGRLRGRKPHNVSHFVAPNSA
jgi:hypothetical protein